MGLFSRKVDLSPLPNDLVVDPTYGDPDLIALRTAIHVRDWPAVTAILDSATDHNHLTYFVDFAADIRGSEQWLADVLARDLESTNALLLHGARHIVWAWEARGRRLANETGRDQFVLFHERLRIAEDCLQSVVRRDPRHATAWSQMIITARGLELGEAEFRHRFAQTVEVLPDHRDAHFSLLQNLCPKWGGSVEAVRAVVDLATTAAPGGSPLFGLVPVLHFELAANLGQEKEKQFTAYLKSREVRDALRQAAARSVNHPDFQRVRDWALTPNLFALLFYLNQDWKSAAEQFSIIERSVTESPWDRYGDDPAQLFMATRNKAFLFA